MICAPSRSACFSYSRLYFSSHVPRPNWLPCEMTSPQPPPTTAPAIAPASAPSWKPCALVAFAVPWRSSTWLSSCAITPTTSPSLCRRLEHAAVDEHRSARQREGVDLLQVHRRERVLEHRLVQLRRRRRDEPLPEPIEIAGERRVVDDRVLLAHFRRRLAPELDVLLGRVLVLRRRDLRLRPRHGGVQQETR